MTQQILFVCSGNYYRSRFAEILFNHLARENNLEWSAESRGLLASLINFPEPISEWTMNGLESRGISPGEMRFPMQLDETDLSRADRVIAMYESEHRPMMVKSYSNWENEIEYWDVPDLDELSPDEALARIEEKVRVLVKRLQESSTLSNKASISPKESS